MTRTPPLILAVFVGAVAGVYACAETAPSLVDPITGRQGVLDFCDVQAHLVAPDAAIAAYDACLADAGLVDLYALHTAASCVLDGGSFRGVSGDASVCVPKESVE